MTAEPSTNTRVKRPTRVMRRDIQALRALAVMLVVANHLWPGRITGGYVGVDVFFVISGFLITDHLARELAETESLSLARFYARRVRRLLPAAFLVLIVSAILTYLLLPALEWRRGAWEIFASAFYIENWALAAQSVNYSALNDAATAAQHYWSLSVEEQFYLVWPLLLLLAWRIARRAKHRPHTALLVGISLIAAASFASSLALTTSLPAQAYFVTPTRAWEFALGGATAILMTRVNMRPLNALTLASLGWVAIALSALLFSSLTPFPGYAAALPVLGTVSVLISNTDRWASPLSSLLRNPGVQWLGDVSYSLYLWHWPLIVFAPYLLSRHPSLLDRVAILCVSLALAGLTRRYIEVPGQRSRFLNVSPQRTFIAMASAMLLIAVLCGTLLVAFRSSPASQSAVPEAPPQVVNCEGPRAAVTDGCDSPFTTPIPNSEMGEANAYYNAPDLCQTDHSILVFGDLNTTTRCDFSGGSADAPKVWLVGDSHAQHWQWLVFDLAREYGWNVTTSYVGGCAPGDVAFIGYHGGNDPNLARRCTTWANAVVDELRVDGADLVFTSAFTRAQQIDDGSGKPIAEQWDEGLSRTWQTWVDVGATVVVLGDAPLNVDVRDPQCIARNAATPQNCGVARDLAQPSDPMLTAAMHFEGSGVVPFDPTAYFCDEVQCYGAVGGVPIYFDADHLNLDVTRMMAPLLIAAHPDLALTPTK